MTTSTSKRIPVRRSSQAKVNRILAEASRILRDSPEGLTTSRLARAARVSPSYLSTYIGTMDSLKEALTKQHFRTLEGLQAEIKDTIQAFVDQPADALPFLLSHLLGRQAPDLVDANSHFEFCRLALQDTAFNSPWAKSLASVFCQNLAERAPCPVGNQVSAARASQTASWACLGLLFGYALTRPRTDYSPEELFHDMTRAALSLLDPDPTHAIQAFDLVESGQHPL